MEGYSGGLRTSLSAPFKSFSSAICYVLGSCHVMFCIKQIQGLDNTFSAASEDILVLLIPCVLMTELADSQLTLHALLTSVHPLDLPLQTVKF